MKIVKNLKKIFLQKETMVYKWAHENKKGIYRATAASALLYLISSIPYLNLVVSKSLVFFIVFLVILAFFKISKRHLVLLGIILIFVAAMLSALDIPGGAEVVGNYVVGIFSAVAVINLLNK